MTHKERIRNWKIHPSQRGNFAFALYKEMVKNENIILLTGDLGYLQWDAIREDFPDRFINVGASEFAMLGIAVGLALEGKIPLVYTITSFYLRAAEVISLYLNGEKANVKMIGGGRDDDYKHDGPSHMCYTAQDFIKSMKNIKNYYPETNEEIPEMLSELLSSNDPSFISVKR